MSLFSNVEPVRFEGADTKNEFAYRVYEKDRVVLGKRMEDWLKVAVCYWHSFNWPGADIFGGGTLQRPWIGASVSQEMADSKLEAAFDFFKRLGVPYFAFHDVDAMATASTLREHDRNLQDDRGRHGAEDGRHGRAAVVGHREPVQPSALRGGCCHEPRPRSVCLGCFAGACLPGSDPPAGRRELRAVGRPRGL